MACSCRGRAAAGSHVLRPWLGLAGHGPGAVRQFSRRPAAMDRIAAVAGWDVLSLMDETDLEKIGLTRWQQPYLFLLEFAQWSQFLSLGA